MSIRFVFISVGSCNYPASENEQFKGANVNGQVVLYDICGAILLGEIFVVLFAVLASRAPLRVVGHFFRTIGLLNGRSTQSAASPPGADPDTASFNPSPDLKAHLGASAFAFLRRALRLETATEKALNAVDPGFNREDGKTEGPYDYAANEEKHLARHGFLFRWISVKPSYSPEISLNSDEVTGPYVMAAKKFFRGQVSIGADVTSLYEDVDAAITISLFRVCDRSCYYLLHQMRRLINDNVRKLAFLYSSILMAILVLELLFLDRIDQNVIASATAREGFLDAGKAYWDRGLSGLMLCAAGAVIMWLTYYMEYSPYQRNNGRELRSFLSRYLSRLSDQYRDSMANARAVTVGDVSNGAALSAQAQKWHKIMLWLSFRAFFIESFVRNVLFQIGRNCGYYIVFVPLASFFLVFTTMWLLVDLQHIDFVALLSAPGPVFYVGFAALVVLAAAFLRHSMNSIDEMNQADWLGFDNLNVDRGMDEVVGKYAEDVGYWKGRLDR